MNTEKCTVCGRFTGKNDGSFYYRIQDHIKKTTEEGCYCRQHGQEMIKKYNMAEKLVGPIVSFGEGR